MSDVIEYDDTFFSTFFGSAKIRKTKGYDLNEMTMNNNMERELGDIVSEIDANVFNRDGSKFEYLGIFVTCNQIQMVIDPYSFINAIQHHDSQHEKHGIEYNVWQRGDVNEHPKIMDQLSHLSKLKDESHRTLFKRLLRFPKELLEIIDSCTVVVRKYKTGGMNNHVPIDIRFIVSDWKWVFENFVTNDAFYFNHDGEGLFTSISLNIGPFSKGTSPVNIEKFMASMLKRSDIKLPNEINVHYEKENEVIRLWSISQRERKLTHEFKNIYV